VGGRPQPLLDEARPREWGRGLSHRSRLARLLDEPRPRVVASEMVVAVRAAVNVVAELESDNGERKAR